MASFQPRSQSDGILVVVNIGGKCVLYFPQEYRVSENVSILRMGKSPAGIVACRCRVRPEAAESCHQKERGLYRIIEFIMNLHLVS